MEYNELVSIVDQQIQRFGRYRPLDLLLEEGRLLRADYERWRAGDIPLLESCLFGDALEIEALLKQAAHCVSGMKLESSEAHYLGWNSGHRKPLRFSPSDTRDRLFRTNYQPAKDKIQLDLFSDNRSIGLQRDIVHSLADRDGETAHHQLDQLTDVDPGHPHLGEYALLIDALRDTDWLEDVDKAREQLETTLVPLASSRLGALASDLLGMYWRGLMQRMETTAFDPDQPRRHKTWCSVQLEDWRLLRKQIEDEPAWILQEELLSRHLLAAVRLGDQTAAILDLLRLVLSKEEDWLNDLFQGLGGSWRRRWLDFLDLDPEVSQEHFPAWLVLNGKATGAAIAGQADLPEGSESLLIASRLVRSGDVETEQLRLRYELQQVAPDLLASFLHRPVTGAP